MNQCAAVNISFWVYDLIIELLSGSIPLLCRMLFYLICYCGFSLFPLCSHFPRAVKFSTEYKKINNAEHSEAKETQTAPVQELWK